MPTKINAFSAVDGEPIHLLDSWFGTQLSGVHISSAETAECGLGARTHSFTSVGAVSSPTDHLTNTTRPLMMSASIGSMSALSESTNVTVQPQPLSAQHTTSTSSSPFSALGNNFASVAHNCSDAGGLDSAQHQRTSAVPSGALSSISHSQPTLGVAPRPHPHQFVVGGLTFEHSEEALAWTLTKRKLLAIIGKADCFVSARLCPYDVLLGVSVVENPEKEKKASAATQAGAGSNQNSIYHTSGAAAGSDVSLASLPSSAGVPTTAVAAHTAIETILPVGRGNFAGAMLAAPIIGPTPTAIFGGSPTCLASSAPTTLVNSPEVPPQQAAGSRSAAAAVSTPSAAPSQPNSAIRHRSTPIAPSHSSYSSNRTGVVVVADPVVEPEYRPWPLTKSTLGEILAQCAEENGVALTAADDAPKASDAVGFAAAMVAKLCRKAVLHNPNHSEAHFVVNLLVFSRPIGNEYAPSHGLYRVPHAPSAVTKERCSSAVVLSVIGKVMEETRLLASGGVVGEDGRVRLVGDAAGATGHSDRPPLPRAAIGVAEKVKQHGLQLLQELHILQLALQASGVNRFQKGGFSGGPNGGSGDVNGEVDANSRQRAAEEAAILEHLLREYFQNSIDVVTQFTGVDDRDALFALMDSADLEAAAARVVEGVGLVGTNAIPIGRLRAYAKDYLDQHTVNEALAAKLGTCLGAINGVGSTASGAPEAAAHYPLVACADRLVAMGYTQEEAGRASRGAGGNFDLAAGFLAGDHSVQRHVKQRCEEVLWFNNVVEALRRGSCKASLQEVTEVVDMVAKDPQSILRAWHTPRLQQAVKALSDAFVQAIMQHKQAAMMRLQQQQQQQAAARMGFSSSSSSTGVAGGGHSVQYTNKPPGCSTAAPAQTVVSLSAALNTAAAATAAHPPNNSQVRGTEGNASSHAAKTSVLGEHEQTQNGGTRQHSPQDHESGAAVASSQTQKKTGKNNNQPLPASAPNFNPNVVSVVGQGQPYHHRASFNLQQGGPTHHSYASSTMASAPFPPHISSTTAAAPASATATTLGGVGGCPPPSYHAVVPPAYGHPHSAPPLNGAGVGPSPQHPNPPPQYHKQQPQQQQQAHMHSTTRPPPKYGNAVAHVPTTTATTATHNAGVTPYPYAPLPSANNNNISESVVAFSAVNAYSTSLPQTYLHHHHHDHHQHQQQAAMHAHQQHLPQQHQHQQHQRQHHTSLVPPQPHQAAPPCTHNLVGGHSQLQQQLHQPQTSQQLPYPFPPYQSNPQQLHGHNNVENPPTATSYNLSAHMPTVPMGTNNSGGFQATVPASASQQQQQLSMYYVQNPPPHGQFIAGGGGGGLAYPAGSVPTITMQQPQQPSGLSAPPTYYHEQQQQQHQQTTLSGQHHATGSNFKPQAQRSHKY